MDSDEVLEFLKSHFSTLVSENPELEFPVTKPAFDSLCAAEVLGIERAVRNQLGERTAEALEFWRLKSRAHYRREILRLGCALLPDLLWDRTRMCAANPPKTVHSLIRQELFAGDLYSPDMLISALERAGKAVADGGRYLDLCCSSGEVVRNLSAAYSRAEWKGCEAEPSSVAWAKRNFPEVSFSVVGRRPELPFEGQSLSGVFSISLWSHLRAPEAADWFAEVHRILEFGGFLVFCTHGLRSLFHYLEQGLMAGSDVAPILADLLLQRAAFHEILSPSSRRRGSEAGNGYLLVEWVALNLSGSWRLLDYQPGLNQFNQDLYVLEKV